MYDGTLLINWTKGYSRYGSGKSGNQVRIKYLDMKTDSEISSESENEIDQFAEE